MKENIVDTLKSVYKPTDFYYGEWNFDTNILREISLTEKRGNMFDCFLERYYYMALNVIFKNDAMVKKFDVSISSRLVNNKRSLYFSKKKFLSNFISNIDEILEKDDDEVYKKIKT